MNAKLYQTLRVIIVGCFFLTSLIKVDAAVGGDSKSVARSSSTDINELYRQFLKNSKESDKAKWQQLVKSIKPVLFTQNKFTEMSGKLDHFDLGLHNDDQLFVFKCLSKKIDIFLENFKRLKDQKTMTELAGRTKQLEEKLIPLMKEIQKRFDDFALHCIADLYKNVKLHGKEHSPHVSLRQMRKTRYEPHEEVMPALLKRAETLLVDAASRRDTSADKQSESFSYEGISALWQSFDTKELQTFVKLSALVLFTPKQLSEISESLDQFSFNLNDDKQVATCNKLVTKIEIFVKMIEGLSSIDQKNKKNIAVKKLEKALIPLMLEMQKRFDLVFNYYNGAVLSLRKQLLNHQELASWFEGVVLCAEKAQEERCSKFRNKIAALLERAKILLEQDRLEARTKIKMMDVD